MKRINVMVSDEAKKKLQDYKKVHRLTTQDEALDEILLKFEDHPIVTETLSLLEEK